MNRWMKPKETTKLQMTVAVAVVAGVAEQPAGPG